MKFLIERADLLSAMTAVASIVERKSTIPILSSVLIDCQGSVVLFRTTNLDMEAAVTAQCDMLGEKGQACVPAQTLLDIARNAPEGAQLSFDLQDRLIVKHGRSRFQLAALAADQFPTMLAEPLGSEFSISSEVLGDMLRRVQFAIPPTPARPNIYGVRLQRVGDLLSACATDSAVMSVVSSPAPEGSDIALTIPPRMVSEMIRLEGDLLVSWSDTKVSVSAGETVITSKLVSYDYVRFPLYDDLPTKIQTDREEMAQMVRRMMIATNQKDSGIRFDFKDGYISCRARNELDAGEDEIRCDYEGATEVGLSGARLLQVLANMKGDVLEIQLGGPAVVLRAPSDPMTVVNLGKVTV